MTLADNTLHPAELMRRKEVIVQAILMSNVPQHIFHGAGNLLQQATNDDMCVEWMFEHHCEVSSEAICYLYELYNTPITDIVRILNGHIEEILVTLYANKLINHNEVFVHAENHDQACNIIDGVVYED